MKTNVIQLEVHDDVISIKDKMAWQSCQRMILVWPKRGRILHNELELVLLNREAKSLGAELALVTHHPVVREWALDSNLPLFASISAAEKAHLSVSNVSGTVRKTSKGITALKVEKEGLPYQKSSSKSANPLVGGLAIFFSLAAVIGLFLVILPQAEITYYPQITMQEIEVKIKASEAFSGVNPSGNIPSEPLVVEVSGEKSIPSSGKAFIPTTRAVGQVVFSNLTSTPIRLPAGTILLAGDSTLQSFSLAEEINVPAGADDSVVSRLEAIVPGVEGNLPAQSVWTLSGGMDSLLSVNNPDAFTGGGGIETPSPSTEDYTTLERQLLAELMAQGMSRFTAEQQPGVGFIETSLSLDKILQSEQVNEVGAPSDEAVMRMTVRVKLYTYQESDLKAIANLVLTANQSAGFRPLNEEISLSRVGDFQVDDFGQATWTINASRLLVPEWNAEQAAAELAGLKVDDARAILNGFFVQTSPAKIKLWLPRWPWMPYLSTNIHFVEGAAS